jgi:hypothetical protein
MGPAPTREGLVKWLNSVEGYTAGGLMSPRYWNMQGTNFEAPAPECLSLGKWDNAANTFINALGSENFACLTTDYYSYAPQGA